jgi:ATP-dependent RNA helicase DDX10/DBP4
METNDFIREQKSIPTTNILIATPGRLLQHLEQTPYFDIDSLQMLVLDEAGKVLAHTMNI